MTESTQNYGIPAASVGTGTEAPCDSGPVPPASCDVSASPGAPPSNTAPANYIGQSTCIFLTGIDSLYLSWTGTLHKEVEEQLSDLKELAQSSNPKDQAQAVLYLLDHRFEVLDKGRGRFPFVLKDNWFDIQVSRVQSTSMPMALVQISSELLSNSGYALAVEKLEALLSKIGQIGEQKISRLDICADFYAEHDLEKIPSDAWVRKSAGLHYHFDGLKFTGISFGSGGAISARLYDKSIEIQKSNKVYFYPLWSVKGWQGELPIWRLEFQFRREALRELGVLQTSNLGELLDGLWQYGCQEWLKLAIPSASDSARTRWPDHPLWTDLKKARFGGKDLSPLNRTRKERLPSHEFMFVNGLGAITSFMASEGIESLSEAMKAYVRTAQTYHQTRYSSGHSLANYVTAKVEQKIRKFNTKLARGNKDDDPEAYRKAKGGE